MQADDEWLQSVDVNAATKVQQFHGKADYTKELEKI